MRSTWSDLSQHTTLSEGREEETANNAPDDSPVQWKSRSLWQAILLVVVALNTEMHPHWRPLLWRGMGTHVDVYLSRCLLHPNSLVLVYNSAHHVHTIPWPILYHNTNYDIRIHHR